MFKHLLLVSIFFPLISWAAPAPETVLTDKCLSAYQNKYKNRKVNKAFVYAREEDTGKNRCQWHYGADDVETAKDRALQACAKYQLNAECIFVDVNGEYLVKDGDFTTITPIDKTPLSASAKDALITEASQLLAGNCLAFFEKYLKDKEHRVFAYAIDADGKYACGKSRGGNLVSVRLSALKACDRNIKKRRKKAPKSECRIYAENKSILLNANDYGVTLSEKSTKTLSKEEYDALLNQAQQHINKGPCVFQMKYYLRAKQHQAFFLATDDAGKQSCGWTEGAFSPEIAEKEALEKCKTNVKKQNLKASCELLAKNFEIVAEQKAGKVVDQSKESDTNVDAEEKYVIATPTPAPKPKPVPKKILSPEEQFKQAIFKGDLDKIKSFVETGLDVNTLSKDNISPLFVAAAKGDERFFNQLLEKGADIKHKGEKGSDVLIAATFGANENIINSLIEKAFNVNTQGREGYAPLHLAVLNKNDA